MSGAASLISVQVLGKAYEALTALVTQAASVSKRDAFAALGGAVDKLSDAKLRGPACSLLDALSEAVGPQFVSAQLHKKAAAHKSPKVSTRQICCHRRTACEDWTLSGPACSLLDAPRGASGSQFVSAQLHKKAAAHKSPKASLS